MSRKKSLPRRARKRSHGAESWPRHLRGVAYSTSKVKVTPFLGLTQTCKSICNEYRQWYLSQSPVSICDIQMYFYAFVEDPKLNWKKAFDIFQQTLRSIKIVLSRCGNVDMIPLLRLKARHTSINIEMGSSGSEHRSQNAPSKQVNEDKNEKWLHWINKELALRSVFMSYSVGGTLRWDAERRTPWRELFSRNQDLHDIWPWKLEEMDSSCPGLKVMFGVAG